MPHRQPLPALPALLVLLASLALLYACDKPQAASPAAAQPKPEVGFVALQHEALTLNTELPGRTSAHLIAEVRPQVGGIVQKRLFREGTEVKAGEMLYQIDPASFQAAYDSAKADLAKAQANIRSLQLKVERYRDLVGIKAVSQQDYDDAKASLLQADAEVEAAKAALETARINLDHTRVTAPISGRIGRSAVTAGALVTADQSTALATIQQLDPIYVDVTRSSTEWLRLQQALASGRLQQPGNNAISVRLRLEDGRDYPQAGRLLFSEVTVDESSGAITLRAEFPNPRQLLLPGMYVRALLDEGVDTAALLVPQRAVSRDPRGGATVYVINADNKIELRSIETERAVGDRWLLRSGLDAGAHVVVDGLQKIRPGLEVKPVAFAPQLPAATVADEAPAGNAGAAR